MSNKFKATPLFDAHTAFVRLPMGMAMFDNYPDSKYFIEQLCETNPDVRQDLQHTQAFLKSYSRKSEATYRGYRNEVERLLLWAWTLANKSVIQLKRPDLESYFDFVHRPPADWVGKSVQDRFKIIDGECRQNKNWRPFAVRIAKEDRKEALSEGLSLDVSRDGHLLSHEAMKICYSAVSCYYDYLTDEGYAFGNPIPAIRKQSPYLIKGATQKILNVYLIYSGNMFSTALKRRRTKVRPTNVHCLLLPCLKHSIYEYQSCQIEQIGSRYGSIFGRTAMAIDGSRCWEKATKCGMFQFQAPFLLILIVTRDTEQISVPLLVLIPAWWPRIGVLAV